MTGGSRSAQLNQLLDRGALAELAYFAEQVENHGWMMDDHHRRLLVDDLADEPLSDGERAFGRWKLELHDDAEVRRWFLDTLDPAVRSEVASMQDVGDRPFTLETDDGPFICSNCGCAQAGRHARVIDRACLLSLVLSSDDLRYCGRCLAEVTSRVGGSGA